MDEYFYCAKHRRVRSYTDILHGKCLGCEFTVFSPSPLRLFLWRLIRKFSK